MSTENAVKYYKIEYENKSEEVQNSILLDYDKFLHCVDDIEDPYGYWCEYIKTDPSSFEYLTGLLQAMRLNRYAIWAINRFTIHGSQEWSNNVHQEIQIRHKIEALEKIIAEKFTASQDLQDMTPVDQKMISIF